MKKKIVLKFDFEVKIVAATLDSLRATFDKMNTAQKKAYIDKLKAKAPSMNNPVYTKFLNECMQKYNAEVRRNTPIDSHDNSDNSPDKRPQDSKASYEKAMTIGAVSVTFFFVSVWVGYGVLGFLCFLIGIFVSLFLAMHAYQIEWAEAKIKAEKKEREEREKKEREEREKKALMESRRKKYMPLYLQALSASGITDKKNTVFICSKDGSNKAIIYKNLANNENKSITFYIWRDSSNLCLFPCGISGNVERDTGSRLLNQIAELDEADFSETVKVIKIPLSKISRFIQNNETFTKTYTTEPMMSKVERQTAMDMNAYWASVDRDKRIPIPPPRYNTHTITITKRIVDLIYKETNGKELTVVFRPTPYGKGSNNSDCQAIEDAYNETREFDDIFNSLIPEKSSYAEDADPPKARNTAALPKSKARIEMTDKKMTKVGITMDNSQLARDIQVKLDDVQKRIDWVIGKISKPINTQPEFDKLFETFQSIVPDLTEAKQMIADLHKQDPTSKIGLKLENQLFEQSHDLEDIMDAFARVLGR